MVNKKSIVKGINFLIYRFRYLFNYIIIGFFSILLEIIIISQFNKIGVSLIFSAPIGFMSGLFLSYILNSRLNFRVPKKNNLRTFALFSTISTISLILNFIIMGLISRKFNVDYTTLRFATASVIFMASYLAHRKITFNFMKNVGIAIYLAKNQSIEEAYSKIKYYCDFIHIDLVDETINKECSEVDLSLIKEINKTWALKKMFHVMSKKPFEWIKKVYPYVDIILFHLEIEDNLNEIIEFCKINKKKCGIILGYESKIKDLMPYIKNIEFVQVMGIKTLGKSGQGLEVSALDKLKELRELQKTHSFDIIFDGGVKPTNIPQISAKYIIAASSLFSSDNPIKSFMELKTSARYRDIRDELRKDIIEGIKETINSIDFVESGTLVGSFAESNSLEGISDIDIVIIADSLTKDKYEFIIECFNKKKTQLESKYGYKIYINNTFGPLKFNERNIVFHLMIYDKQLHKQHCQKSPFTCFDWQRSPIFVKKSMAEIYKVRMIQPSDFFNTRRSASEYLSDVLADKISYREYLFDKDKILEEKKYKLANVKDKIEFSYHIANFLMSNFLKLYFKENKRHDLRKTMKLYFRLFPKNRIKHEIFIKKLEKMKKKNTYESFQPIKKNLELFIKDFEFQFKNYFNDSSKEIIFFRHAKTKLNKKNLFIGQRQNPNITKLDKKTINKFKEIVGEPNFVVSSPLSRCLGTLKELGFNKINLDSRLKEIDYGLADGKDPNYIKQKHPFMLKAWELGEDPKFPQGENYLDVMNRMNSFLADINVREERNIAVCTHNVVLRILIGLSLRIPKKEWYKITVPHLEQFKFFLKKDGKLYIDLSSEQIREVLKQFKNG